MRSVGMWGRSFGVKGGMAILAGLFLVGCVVSGKDSPAATGGVGSGGESPEGGTGAVSAHAGASGSHPGPQTGGEPTGTAGAAGSGGAVAGAAGTAGAPVSPTGGADAAGAGGTGGAVAAGAAGVPVSPTGGAGGGAGAGGEGGGRTECPPERVIYGDPCDVHANIECIYSQLVCTEAGGAGGAVPGYAVDGFRCVNGTWRITFSGDPSCAF